eukprot:CAMPEP_0184295602 /NCGR_PEP_ID=MMETSP1049-20130417/6451_1 /TAXON_ID=77928 /ORGANISM="Proteomonas sulcata, Strain CCMP704" /LENGTH=61 /DNA_ID=CAMNT_0026604223 /DNA_START=438 /DNA_END=619 /DNA_ORIENTATION=-
MKEDQGRECRAENPHCDEGRDTSVPAHQHPRGPTPPELQSLHLRGASGHTLTDTDWTVVKG